MCGTSRCLRSRWRPLRAAAQGAVPAGTNLHIHDGTQPKETKGTASPFKDRSRHSSDIIYLNLLPISSTDPEPKKSSMVANAGEDNSCVNRSESRSLGLEHDT